MSIVLAIIVRISLFMLAVLEQTSTTVSSDKLRFYEPSETWKANLCLKRAENSRRFLGWIYVHSNFDRQGTGQEGGSAAGPAVPWVGNLAQSDFTPRRAKNTSNHVFCVNQSHGRTGARPTDWVVVFGFPGGKSIVFWFHPTLIRRLASVHSFSYNNIFLPGWGHANHDLRKGQKRKRCPLNWNSFWGRKVIPGLDLWFWFPSCDVKFSSYPLKPIMISEF